jgi:hypothetical protein
VADFVVEDDDSNFLIGTLYNAPGGNDSLVNGAYSVSLGNTGTLTLPAGGTISEGYVTSNPTIQLTPATPDVASQKLVIKGGGGQYYITENGIGVGTNNNVWEVTDSATFYVYAPTRPDETLYWWIVPEEGGISTTMSGTVELNGNGDGVFNFTVISDAYEFKVRVSPEEDNYDPENIGVESVLMNGDAPAYGDYHLHLTTGDLAETSIFLGTDDHNVRTTTDGKIQITTPGEGNNLWEFGTDGITTLPSSLHFGSDSFKIEQGQGSRISSEVGLTLIARDTTDPENPVNRNWEFGTDGSLTIPGDIRSEGNIDIEINLSDSTLRRWQFGEDGDLTLPAGGDILDSTGTSVLGGGASTGDFTFSNADITVTDNASLTVTGDSIFTATISSSGGMFWSESNSFLGTYTSDSLGYSDFGQFDGQKVIFFDNVMSDNLSTELSAMAIGDTILVDELSNPYTVTLTSTFLSLMGRFIASVTTAETNRTVTNQVVITRTVSETNEFQFKGNGELVAPKIVAATSLIIPSYTINECGFGRNTVAGTNGAIISVSDSDQDVANPGGVAGYYTPNMLAYWVGNINQNPSPGQEAGAWVYLHQDGSSYYLVGN